MTIAVFNQLEKNEAARQLFTCCGSANWQQRLMESFPFVSPASLMAESEHAWYGACQENDWLEAFTQHPKIGDVSSLREKFASTSHLAGKEQAGVNNAPEEIIQRLAEANQAYEKKFGFIFIVCATGKSAADMLRLMEDRLENSRDEELAVAMGEQHKITILRLKKLLPEADWGFLKVSQITTHVLDTSLGKPGENISIRMKEKLGSGWKTIAQGVTNADGRIPDLLPPGRVLIPGTYQMQFDTGRYFLDTGVQGFYPEVGIQFTVRDGSHYHVPLLINPFGYSTYRGS